MVFVRAVKSRVKFEKIPVGEDLKVFTLNNVLKQHKQRW